MLYAATERVFRTASRVRGRRIFHPEGVGFRGRLTVEHPRPEGLGTALFGAPGYHPVVVRISRGGGFPARVPDVLGIAFRVENAYGASTRQDLLLATGRAAPLGRNLVLPEPRGFGAATYSSLFPYRLGDRVRLLAAYSLPPRRDLRTFQQLRDAAAGLRFAICAAGFAGAWRELATLTLGPELPAPETEALRFDPWNTGGGIRPFGPLMGLRRPAYAGSQRGRLASGR